ncbi:MAG: hypothetical protein II786_04160 [Muribaculaceae bacterium]|nr:hypothetical protein [Muribaculaceae bacterium]
MKRLSLVIIFACFILAMSAQDGFRVHFQGAKPTITDLAWAFLCDCEANDEECGDRPALAVKDALSRHRKGLPQEEGVTLRIDQKNGYILYEWQYETCLIRMEMCYWNESDGKHKLFVFNNMASLCDGKPVVTETSGLVFCRYNNATKKMTYCDDPFTVDYQCTYALPSAGKDIIVTPWDESGNMKQPKTLKWNGRRFNY